MINEKVTIHNIASGALIERFDVELKRVIKNIMDPNTTEDAREVIVKVKIKPDANRQACAVNISCVSKLAPLSPVTTAIFVGIKNNEVIALENDPNQTDMFGTEQPENAIEISAKKEATNDKGSH